MSEAPEYQAAITDLNESFRAGIKAFAKWVAGNWKITEADWAQSFDQPVPTAEFFRGYNQGIESVEGAAEAFLDEFHP